MQSIKQFIRQNLQLREKERKICVAINSMTSRN